MLTCVQIAVCVCECENTGYPPRSVPLFPVCLPEPCASDEPLVSHVLYFIPHAFRSQMCPFLPWSSLNEQNAFAFRTRSFLMNSTECNILCNKNNLLPGKSF